MGSIKVTITDQYHHAEGLDVGFVATRDGETVVNTRLNFPRGLTAAEVKAGIKRFIEETITAQSLDNADLSSELGQVVDLEALAPAPIMSLEEAQSKRLHEIDLAVSDFLAQKNSGGSRYVLQHQIATLASMVSAKDKIKDTAIDQSAKDAAKAKFDRINQMWAWIEQVFIAQETAKARVLAAQTAAEASSVPLDLGGLDASDPDVYLAEIWDRPIQEA